MASIGVVRSAQYPQAPTSTKNAITRNRFLSDTSMSQLITRCDLSPASAHAENTDGRRRQSVTSRKTDYELRREAERLRGKLERRRCGLESCGQRHRGCPTDEAGGRGHGRTRHRGRRPAWPLTHPAH